ncbi:MAG: CPBP family intramembrane glutamic endopeptidase [Clostridia bacterium]|nr:CPBP family intramembrane glutamic endopeptidase [Clostridia bacterium]
MKIGEIKIKITRACCAIFIYIGVLSAVNTALTVIFEVIRSLNSKYGSITENINIAENICLGLTNVASYIASVLIYKTAYSSEYRHIRFDLRLGTFPFSKITACLGLVVASSHIMRYFGYGGSEYINPIHGEDIIIMMFTTVLVPAFCEELFFRGLIMTNLMPLGRNFAIISSGILFGLAHANHDQILFASIAGIALGYIYAESGSIWCGIIIHMMNNFISVTETVIVGNLKYSTALIICSIIELTVLICGAASLLYLVFKLKNEKSEIINKGFFATPSEKLLDNGVRYSTTEYLRGFFCPAMIIFIVYILICEVIYVGVY